MFPLVKLVFLLSILSGTANAQWGAVVAQSDTNRFITSQEKFGLIMPHQEVIVGLLDTTITSASIGGGNASKVIVGSLLDHEDNCANYSVINGVASCAGSYQRWRDMEKSTNWYQADRGDTTAMFPTNYAITISTGNDSIKIWNRDTAESWMVFLHGSNYMVNKPASEAISNIAFKDGTLRVASSGTYGGVNVIDFLNEKNSGLFYTAAGGPYQGTIQERNDGLGYLLGTWPNSILVSRDVRAIAVVRDPFGLTDGIGRPKHWWDAGTAGGISTYNPHTNSIYDSGMSGIGVDAAYTSRGSTAWIRDTAEDEIVYIRTGFDRVADSYGRDYSWSYGAVGAKALPSGEDYDYGAFIEGGSIVGRNEDVVVVGGSFGTYLLHQGGSIDTGEDGAKVKITATVNTPVQLGDCVLALALEDNTTDSSTDANTMTAANSPGTTTAVFGNGYSSTVDSYLYRNSDSDFNLGTADWYVAMWMKTHSATNPGATERLWSLNYAPEGAHNYQVDMHIKTTGYLGLRIWDDGGSSTDNVDPDGDYYDGEWHHVVATRGGANWHVIVDGIKVGTTAVANAAGSIDTDDLNIGTYWNGGNPYTGLFDDFSLGKQEMTTEVAARIHAEGRKKLGMGTPVFTRTTDDALLSNNVVDVDALDNGIWAVVFSDAATAQVFDGRIPIQQIAAPAGTVKSVALIQSPGTDSVGVAIGTTTNLKFVQPSVNLREAMAHQYKEPIHVGESVGVDSAGQDGIFWTADDALDAATNANRGRIFVNNGTYMHFDLDQSRMYVECESHYAVFDGGTTDDAIDVTAPRSVIDGCKVRTTAGGGSAFNGITIAATGDSTKIIGVHIEDSDNIGLFWTSGANVGWILDSTIDGADDNCMGVHALQVLVSGNQIRSCGARGINVDAGGDIQITGNHLRGMATECITIRSGSHSDNCVIANNFTSGGTYGVLIAGSDAANNVVVGNRLSGASTSNYTDSGTNTTAAGNNTN